MILLNPIGEDINIPGAYLGRELERGEGKGRAEGQREREMKWFMGVVESHISDRDAARAMVP